MEIIAELGKNWIYTEDELSVEENLERAKELVVAAKEAGADVVKFQTHADDEYSKRSPARREWIDRNIRGTPYNEFWTPLKRFCDDLGIEFLTTPMSRKAAQMMNPLVKRWKVSSADIVDTGLLKYLKSTNKPVILSSGMSTEEQIEKAVRMFSGPTLLHCVSIYPCPEELAQLGTIPYLKRKFPHIRIGYSDHTTSTIVPAMATVLGACLIEKHFTLSTDSFGPDHLTSMTPGEFKEMVKMVKDAQIYYGKEEKVLLDKEKSLWQNFRNG